MIIKHKCGSTIDSKQRYCPFCGDINLPQKYTNMVESEQIVQNEPINIRSNNSAILLFLAIWSAVLGNIIFPIVLSVFFLIWWYSSSVTKTVATFDPVTIKTKSNGPYLFIIFAFYLAIHTLLLEFDLEYSFSVLIAFIIAGPIIQMVSPPDIIREKNNQNRFVPVICLIFSSILLIFGVHRAFYMFFFALSAVSMIFYPQISNSKIYQKQEKDDKVEFFEPLQIEEKVSPIIQSERNINIGSKNSISSVQSHLHEIELQHSKIESFYNVINENINLINGKLQAVKENSFVDRKTKIDQLFDIANLIKSTSKSINYWDAKWKQLHEDYKIDEINSMLFNLESQIKQIRDSLPALDEKIVNNSSKIFEVPAESLLEKMKSMTNQHNEILEMINAEIKEEKIEAEKIRIEKETLLISQKEERQQKSINLNLSSIISDKILGNLLAYAGATFLVLAFFYALIWSYENFILLNFPTDASTSQATLGVVVLYVIATIFSFNNVLLKRISEKLVTISRLISSLGLVLFQFTFYIQTSYFVNLNLDGNYLIYPGLILIFLSIGLGYYLRSQVITFTGASIALYLNLIIGSDTFTTSKLLIENTIVGTSARGSLILLINLVIITTLVLITIRRKLWIANAVFSLLSPVIWIFTATNIAAPEILSLSIAVVNVGLVITKKLPTPRPFSHFMGLFLLILNNVTSIIFTIGYLENLSTDVSNLFLLKVIFVYGAFYSTYWIFVFVEKELDLSLDIPVNFNFSEDKVRMQSIQQRLNWLMLSSLIFLCITVLLLQNFGIYTPTIYFAIILSVSVIIGFKVELEKIVKNSIFLMLIETELLFFLSLSNPNAGSISNSLATGLFISTFTLIYYGVFTFRKEIGAFVTKAPPKAAAVLIGVSAIINSIISGESEDYGIFVLLLTTMLWVGMTITMLQKREKTEIDGFFIHLSLYFGLIFQFIFGLIRQGRKFPIDYIAKTMTIEIHIAVNISFLLYLGIAIYYVFKGDKLVIFDSKIIKHKNNPSLWDRIKNLDAGDHIYLPQIILFVFPSILIMFGNPYFYYPPNNQAILLLYFFLYFLLMPMLVSISMRKSNGSFDAIAGFSGYFAFIGGFVLLGGAKKLYDIIIRPPPSTGKPVYFIAPEWAIFILILVFVLMVTWLTNLSNTALRRLESKQQFRIESKFLEVTE